ncbi:MAG TPA: hypothetical protein VGQ18_03310 [Gemmatimonadales bacterium]|jgi:hypothetical protein|nr:hypothetical protein [Gemmatimonadales bacterium]
MRSFSLAILVFTGLTVPAAAQTGSESNLVFTIFGGTVTGHSLWTVGKQPLTVLSDPSKYDTLDLSRSVSSSMVLGLAATYFLSPHVGVHLELSYLGLPVESRCTGVFFHPDSNAFADLHRNEQVCDDIQSQSADGGAIAIFGGVTLRAASRRTLSPYVRGNFGIVNEPRSTIEMAGAFIDGDGILKDRQVLADASPRRTSVMYGAAAGFTSPLGPGYAFRFELRDVVVSLDRLAGPANGLGVGPITSKAYHHISLTLGLDVVLERKRGRRY